MHDASLKQITQGTFAATKKPNVTFISILGSCVAVCLYDPKLKIGGMNHFLLPGTGTPPSKINSRFGIHSMELLINEMIKLGANRHCIIAKAFGGGQITKGYNTIGQRNIDFVRTFLETERINCVSESLGDRTTRQVKFWPSAGHVRLKLMPTKNVEQTNREQDVPSVNTSGNVTLF